MDESTKVSKRIVSKGRFVFNTGQKASLLGVGFVLLLLASVAMFATVAGIIYAFCGGNSWTLGITLLVGCLAGVLFYLGGNVVKLGDELETGVPWTHANTTGLPAEESLVRASVEPELQQPEVLLRPAAYTDQTPAEELVRSSLKPPDA